MSEPGLLDQRAADPRRPKPRTVYTPAQEPFARHLQPVRIAAAMWQHRRLIGQLTLRRFQERFKGSWLGLLWVWLLPLCMLAVYAFAFVGVLGIGGKDATTPQRIELVLSIFCGLITYSAFAETAQRSATCITGQPQFVKRIVFPLQTLPVVAFGESLLVALGSTVVLLAGVVLLQGRVHASWLLLPAVFANLALMSVGVGWFVAALGVFVRDLGQILAVVLQMLFFLTPVFYRLQDVPPWAQGAIALNPFTGMVEAVRAIALRGELPPLGMSVYATAVGLAAAVLGHAVFQRVRRRFADVL